ncbi:GntR family transcriptional regulator [Streptosporangium lutulentum]
MRPSASWDPSSTEPPGEIDRGSSLPYHEQIYRLLLDMIVSGRLVPGGKLMQEKEYAARLGVSLAPVRQAILALVKDGYLTRTRGRGTYVREAKVGTRIQLLSSFTATLKATGLPTAMRVLTAETIPAAIRPSEALRIPDGAELFRLRRVAFLAANRWGCSRRHCRCRCSPDCPAWI